MYFGPDIQYYRVRKCVFFSTDKLPNPSHADSPITLTAFTETFIKNTKKKKSNNNLRLRCGMR